MAIDLFFRAETVAALRTVVRSAPFRNIIGDVREPAGPGFIQIAGSVDWVFFRPDRVVVTPAVLDGDGNVITPAVTDSWAWLHLRLTGPAEAADHEDDPGGTEPDRWRKSRLKRWIKENGTLRTIRGVRVWQHTLGNGKHLQIWRGSQMEDLGIKFHEFMGGNSY